MSGEVKVGVENQAADVMSDQELVAFFLKHEAEASRIPDLAKAAEEASDRIETAKAEAEAAIRANEEKRRQDFIAAQPKEKPKQNLPKAAAILKARGYEEIGLVVLGEAEASENMDVLKAAHEDDSVPYGIRKYVIRPILDRIEKKPKTEKTETEKAAGTLSHRGHVIVADVVEGKRSAKDNEEAVIAAYEDDVNVPGWIADKVLLPILLELRLQEFFSCLKEAESEGDFYKARAAIRRAGKIQFQGIWIIEEWIMEDSLPVPEEMRDKIGDLIDLAKNMPEKTRAKEFIRMVTEYFMEEVENRRLNKR